MSEFVERLTDNGRNSGLIEHYSEVANRVACR